jgi:hypothetical protein
VRGLALLIEVVVVVVKDAVTALDLALSGGLHSLTMWLSFIYDTATS